MAFLPVREGRTRQAHRRPIGFHRIFGIGITPAGRSRPGSVASRGRGKRNDVGALRPDGNDDRQPQERPRYWP